MRFLRFQRREGTHQPENAKQLQIISTRERGNFMRTDLMKMTQEWMQLERKTIEQRRQTSFMRVI